MTDKIVEDIWRGMFAVAGLAVLLLVIVAIGGCCISNTNQATKLPTVPTVNGDRMMVISSQDMGTSRIYVVKDKITGKEFVIVHVQHGVAITPITP